MKVMIVGAGKLGYKLAEAMNHEDMDVTLVDKNEDILKRVGSHLDVFTIQANGIELGRLKELDVGSYDLLVAATDSDEVNTLICTLAKKLNCKETIARIREPEFIEQLDFVKEHFGIDFIINPDLATAIEIKRYVSKTYNFYTGDFAKGKVSMIDFHLGEASPFINKRIMDIEGLEGLLITAVSRNGELIIPYGSTKLLVNDVIYVIGESENINNFAERIGINLNKIKSERVLILGGGNIGFYLAEKLEKLGIKATIIEKDKERCEYLAERLDRTLVIYGDGTDMDLLQEEDLESYDTFIGVTGFDELNLLMALVAKQSGVDKTIAKTSRPNYAHIVDRLDVDIALNPINITISNILKYIRGGKVVSVSLLLGGEGEVTEMIISKGSPIIGKPLAKLGLPKGIIIGAIVHNGKVHIPNGNSIIQEGDRIIVFSLASDTPILNKLTRPSKKGGLFNGIWGSR
ncbi:MAG: Trk system potassium transporter TrkA [Tissierellia bacterium]|nr:Trk system potassium transporter TrkA [Tissierellia bacterium]